MFSKIDLPPNTKIVTSDSYNYTFNLQGSILGILILSIITELLIDKLQVIIVYFSSITGIIIINRFYYSNFRSNHLVIDTIKDEYIRFTEKLSIIDEKNKGYIDKINQKKADTDLKSLTQTVKEKVKKENEIEYMGKYSKKLIYKAIESLADGYKVVFYNFFFNDKSHKEIADMLGISEGTSRSQLMKAKNVIKKYLETHS